MLNKCIVIFSFSLALASSIKAQNNVACINQDEVINRMPEVALANNILKQFQDSLQQIIQKRRDEYYEKMTNWMKTCGDILTPVPDSSRAKKRQDAIDEVVQLSQLDSDMQLLIKTKAINLFKPILDKFKTELKKNSQRKCLCLCNRYLC
jgi:Skp family chaperone for outer membrane proteins